MTTKRLLLSLFILVLLFPVYVIYRFESLPFETGIEKVRSLQKLMQISLWISWVIVVSIAVYYKWTRKNNLFFLLVYIFIGLGFTLFGHYVDQISTTYKITTSLDEDFPVGIFVAVQNIVTALILTAFLQISVWWFTRRWHRR